MNRAGAICKDPTRSVVVVLKSRREMDGDGGGSGDGFTASGINFEQERAFHLCSFYNNRENRLYLITIEEASLTEGAI